MALKTTCDHTIALVEDLKCLLFSTFINIDSETICKSHLPSLTQHKLLDIRFQCFTAFKLQPWRFICTKKRKKKKEKKKALT